MSKLEELPEREDFGISPTLVHALVGIRFPNQDMAFHYRSFFLPWKWTETVLYTRVDRDVEKKMSLIDPETWRYSWDQVFSLIAEDKQKIIIEHDLKNKGCRLGFSFSGTEGVEIFPGW